MRRAPAVVLSALALAAGAALVGCGDDADDPEAVDPGTSETATTGDTPPGTVLAVGETAVIPTRSGDGTIALTVTEILAGDPEEVSVAADRPGAVPYYVHYDLEARSGSVGGVLVSDYLSVWSGDGLVSSVILNRESVPSCQEQYLPVDAVPGTSVTACRVYVADPGQAAPDAVKLDNADAYRYADDTAVVWRR